MDLQYLFNVLWRRKWVLLLAVFTAIGLTYFLVGLKSPSFKSKAILSTGITTTKRIKLSTDDAFVQKFEVISAFSNLKETMKSRTSLRLLSYTLLTHDLMADIIGEKPFRQLPEDAEITASDREVRFFSNKLYLQRDSLWFLQITQEEDAIFKELSKAYGYDHESLLESFSIDRVGDTDYLRVEFESESAELCEFAVNNFIQLFIRYNMLMQNRDENQAVLFYKDLTKQKKQRVDELTRQLNNFKQGSNIVNMDKQSETVVDQLKDLEVAREEAKKDIEGFKRNILSLNSYLQEEFKDSEKLVQLYQQLNTKLDDVHGTIKDIKEEQVEEGNEAGTNDELVSRGLQREDLIKSLAKSRTSLPKDEEKALLNNLLEMRIKEELNLSLAEASVTSLNEEIERVKSTTTDLVLAEANIDLLESQKEIAMNEYLQSFSRLNDARVIAESALNPLSVFEYAQIPEEPEPAKRLLFSAFAGAATGAIGVFLIFMTLLFDTSFHSPQQFERLTGVPLLGFINQVKRKKLNLQEVFNGFDNHISINQYKESLRRIRYSIEQSGAKRFLFTSTQPHSGKTFTVLSLAYSLSKKNHRVAVLDTNFKHNNLTRWANTDTKRNPLLTNGRDAFYDVKKDRKKPLLQVNGEISIIGSVLSGDSPSEIFAGKDFEGFLNALEQKYDYILMEGAAMNEYSDSQELVEYAEKVIAVFEAEDRLRRADKESIVILQSLNDKFMGGILNQVNLKQLDDVS